MKKISAQVMMVVLLLSTLAYASRGKDLSQNINEESQRAWSFLLQNISRVGAASGSVVAAPSKVNPDYYFHWVRDAALVMGSILQTYERAEAPAKENLKQMITDYVKFSRSNQTTINISGGLGEPKFNMDGSAFNDPWGRPQNDGPALRAITLIQFSNQLLQEGQESYVRLALYDGKIPTDSVIKSDLEYVAYHWQEPCFDLWEETFGHHFYSELVSRRALLEGALLAERLGDEGAAVFYRDQAAHITNTLNKYWDSSRKILLATRDETDRFGNAVVSKKSGIDVAIVLAALHGDAGDGFFSSSNDQVMATAFNLMTSFQAIYDINKNTNLAPAIGRYPEDSYSGSEINEGNPWFLSTLAYSELCNRIRSAYEKEGVIHVTALNQQFLNYILPNSITAGMTITRKSVLFNQILLGLKDTADRFFATVLAHTGQDGSMAEQFSRHNGFMMSAPNLSWSYAAFLTATWWRNAP